MILRASTLLLLSMVLFACPGLAQQLQLKGQVVDDATRQGIAYATLGIKDQMIGSVADVNGQFAFALPEGAAATGQVLVSCVGYQTEAVALADFKAGPQLIRLHRSSQLLREVLVRGGKVKSKEYGRTANSTLMVAAMYTEAALVHDELGKEQGTVVAIDRNCYLKDFNMHVAFNRFKSVTFRLNLYSVQNGLPDRPLLAQDVRFDVTQPRGWVKVDLTPYNLHLQNLDKVAVTIQWLHSEAAEGASKAFGVSAVPALGHSVLFRDKSQAPWRQVKPGYLSFYLSADAYGATKEAPAASADYVMPDSLRYLRYLSGGSLARPSSHHYGDSAAVGRYVAVPGARLYYETYGQGPPLLLLHGNGQSISAFSQQIGPLTRHFRVIAVDTRGQGKSLETVPQELTYDLFAADMRLLLDSLHISRTDVLGWSDGGNTGLKLALHDPSYVNRLVVMGANLFPTPEALESGVLQLFRKQLQALAPRHDAPAETQKRLLRLLLEQPQMRFEELQAIKAPTLVLAGQYDVVMEKHTRAISDYIKGAQLTIFPGASHYAPQEIPEQFNARVEQFLR